MATRELVMEQDLQRLRGELAATVLALTAALALLDRVIALLRVPDSSRRDRAHELLEQAGYPPNAVD